MDAYQIYAIYLIAISLITFTVYFIDKVKAKANAWRIPEKALLILSLIGGGFGGFLSMSIFRHKTKHWYFVVINLFSIVLHVAGLIASVILL